jgi:hypothetical protein
VEDPYEQVRDDEYGNGGLCTPPMGREVVRPLRRSLSGVTTVNGALAARETDLQVRAVLHSVMAAMRDEGIAPDVRARIISRVTLGDPDASERLRGAVT